MAEFHLSLKIGGKGKATPHFHYITATEKYAAKRGVVHVESGNMPTWSAADPALYWQASDEFERANGTTYREIEVALPRELPLPIQLDLARRLAAEVCDEKHAYSFAIHHTLASDGGLNPHVHLQFSERTQDGIERDMATFFRRANKASPEKGGCVKDRSWQATSKGQQKRAESCNRLLEIRKAWADMCNQALEANGIDDRIDHRSLKDQGIDRIPQPKVGAKSWHLFERTGEKNECYKRWEAVIASNNAIITKTASKPNALEKLAAAEQRLSKASGSLAALQPIRRPSKADILQGIIEKQKHVRRLSKEIWQLEHVTRHTAYDDMKQAQWKRDAGGNWLTRAWNRFYYGGDFNRLQSEYEDVLSVIQSKTKAREKLIDRLSKHPHATAQTSVLYAEKAAEYHAYLRRKAELESDLQTARQDVESCRHLLPQPDVQRRQDHGHHMSLRM